MTNNLQIIVIAGGTGARMAPLSTAKTLFPFLGVTILEHCLNNLKQFNSAKTIIVCNPATESEVAVIAKKLGFTCVTQLESLGMADAILTAKSEVDLSNPLLVLDAVTVQDPQVYLDFGGAMAKSPTVSLLGGRHVDEYKPGGYFVFDSNNHITKIIEKPGANMMPSSYLKLVLDYFPVVSDLIEMLEMTESDHDDVYEVAISSLIKTGNFSLVKVGGDHASLKYPHKVLDVMDVFLKHYLKPKISKSAKIASNATIVGDVYLGENVQVYENAVIKGPVYIGDNTVIGNGVLIRQSCIEANCEIGYNSEIARSYIGPKTKCHTSYVGDSIVEGESNLAAGTITANLRFDNKTVMVTLPSGRFDTGRRKFGAILGLGTKTGIHASIMPGVVTKPGSIIGSEVQYSHDKV